MIDTPTSIENIQSEIWFSLHSEEKMKIALDMMQFGRDATLSRFRELYPEKNERELVFELVKEWYAKDYSQQQFLNIEKLMMSNFG